MAKQPRMEMGVVDDKGVFHRHTTGSLNSVIATATAGVVRGTRLHLASRDTKTGKVTKHGVFKPTSLAGHPASNTTKRV